MKSAFVLKNIIGITEPKDPERDELLDNFFESTEHITIPEKGHRVLLFRDLSFALLDTKEKVALYGDMGVEADFKFLMAASPEMLKCITELLGMKKGETDA